MQPHTTDMIATLSRLKRNRFFSGKLLTVEDLALEQEYFRERLKRHNRYLHGFGVVFGLEVSKNGKAVIVSPGLAIDCQGNEIVVPEPMDQPLPASNIGSTLFLGISYAEIETEPVAGLVPGSLENSKLEESAVAVLENGNANQGHRHLKGRWRACGKSHRLTIAKLRFSSGQWRIDRRYRAPMIK